MDIKEEVKKLKKSKRYPTAVLVAAGLFILFVPGSFIIVSIVAGVTYFNFENIKKFISKKNKNLFKD